MRNVDTLFSYLFSLESVFTECIQKKSEIWNEISLTVYYASVYGHVTKGFRMNVALHWTLCVFSFITIVAARESKYLNICYVYLHFHYYLHFKFRQSSIGTIHSAKYTGSAMPCLKSKFALKKSKWSLFVLFLSTHL